MKAASEAVRLADPARLSLDERKPCHKSGRVSLCVKTAFPSVEASKRLGVRRLRLSPAAIRRPRSPSIQFTIDVHDVSPAVVRSSTC